MKETSHTRLVPGSPATCFKSPAPILWQKLRLCCHGPWIAVRNKRLARPSKQHSDPIFRQDQSLITQPSLIDTWHILAKGGSKSSPAPHPALPDHMTTAPKTRQFNPPTTGKFLTTLPVSRAFKKKKVFRMSVSKTGKPPSFSTYFHFLP